MFLLPFFFVDSTLRPFACNSHMLRDACWGLFLLIQFNLDVTYQKEKKERKQKQGHLTVTLAGMGI